MNSTTAGWMYQMIICSCGRQNSAGVCEHFPNGSLYREHAITPGTKFIPVYRPWVGIAAITLTLLSTSCAINGGL